MKGRAKEREKKNPLKLHDTEEAFSITHKM